MSRVLVPFRTARRLGATAFLLIPALLVACSDGETPTGTVSEEKVDTPELVAFSMIAATASQNGVTFLSPITSEDTAPVPLDESLVDHVRFEVCEVSGSGACIRVVAAFDADSRNGRGGRGGQSTAVRLTEDAYQANWTVEDVSGGATVRIRVLVAGTDLGSINGLVVASQKDAKDAERLGVPAFRTRSTIPIRAHIAQGAVRVVGPDGGQLSSEDGTLAIEIPVGALDAPVGFTVAAATELPADPTLIAETAYRIGPDAVTFNEPAQVVLTYGSARPQIDTVPEFRFRVHRVVDGSWAEEFEGSADLDANTVTGTVGGAGAIAVLRRRPPVRVEVSPATQSLGAFEAVGELSATAYAEGGWLISDAGFVWHLATEADADVVTPPAPTGDFLGTASVSAVGNGVAGLVASSEGVSASANVEVAQVAVSVEVTPVGPVTLNRLGATQALSAVAKDAGGAVMAGATFTWASTNTAAATLGADGTVTAVANGSTDVTATSGSITSNAVVVTVAQVVATVEVTPTGPVTLTSLGATQSMSAVAKDAGGAVVAGATFTWASTNTAAATVGAEGTITAAANGSTDVTATSNSVTSNAVAVTVAQAVATVEVTPIGPVTLTSLGATQALGAVARDAGGAVVAGATFTWASTNTAAATVGADGTVTAVANGSTDVTATSSSVTSNAVTVTVAQAVATVEVTPVGPVTLTSLGATQALGAVAKDAGGTVVAGATFTWASTNTAAATVGADGTVTAVADGSTDVTATSSSMTSNAVTVTVAQAVATVEVTPVGPVTLTSLGATQALGAVAKDAGGTVVAGATFTWASTNTAAATVGADGTVTAVADGSTDVSATSGSITSNAVAVAVAPAVATVEVTTIGPVTLTSLGATEGLAALAKDAGGAVVAGATFTWASANTAAATVGADGTVTAVANGSTDVTATSSSVTSNAVAVTVAQVAARIDLSPGTGLLDALGVATSVEAAAWDAHDFPIEDAALLDLTWSSSDATIAAVAGNSPTGAEVTATGNGTASILATDAAGAVGTFEMIVRQFPIFLRVAGQGQVGDAGTALGQPFVAQALDRNGVPVAGIPVEWTVLTGGGSLSGVAPVTDDAGRTSALLTLGSAVEQNRVEVAAANQPSAGGTFDAVPVAAQIGGSGGTIEASDGDLTLEIPGGALAAGQSISVRAVNPRDLGILPGAVAPGTVFDFGPDGLQFDADGELLPTPDVPVVEQPEELRDTTEPVEPQDSDLSWPDGFAPVNGDEEEGPGDPIAVAPTQEFETEEPVRLTLRWDELPAGLTAADVDALVLAKWDPDTGSWIEQEGSVVDPVAKTVSAAVKSFSVYGVVPRFVGPTITGPASGSMLAWAHFRASTSSRWSVLRQDGRTAPGKVGGTGDGLRAGIFPYGPGRWIVEATAKNCQPVTAWVQSVIPRSELFTGSRPYPTDGSWRILEDITYRNAAGDWVTDVRLEELQQEWVCQDASEYEIFDALTVTPDHVRLVVHGPYYRPEVGRFYELYLRVYGDGKVLGRERISGFVQSNAGAFDIYDIADNSIYRGWDRWIAVADTPGTSVIRAQGPAGLQSAAFEIFSLNAALPASVQITPGNVTIQEGQTVDLNATVRDAQGNVLQEPVTWTSNFPAAAVDHTGRITTVGVGTSVITATTLTGVSASVTVTVLPSLATWGVSAGSDFTLSGASSAGVRVDISAVSNGTPRTWDLSSVAPISGTVTVPWSFNYAQRTGTGVAIDVILMTSTGGVIEQSRLVTHPSIFGGSAPLPLTGTVTRNVAAGTHVILRATIVNNPGDTAPVTATFIISGAGIQP